VDHCGRSADNEPVRPNIELAIPYVASLDGLRGVAVICVVLFHQRFTWAQGGFLGVSVFFTLSGFLITLLLMAEHEGAGRIDLARFFGRRLDRLAPPALVVIVATVLVWSALRDPTLAASVPGDALASVLQLTNWWFVVGEQSYADLFRTPSPLLHFWSLAIEEQFYLLWPILFGLVLKSRRTRSRLALVGTLAVLSASVPIWQRNFDLIYYGTHSRAAELLAGALLAIVSRPRFASLASGSTPTSRWTQAVGGLSLAALVLAVVALGQTAQIWRHGGLPAMGLVSVGILWSALAPGPIRRLLSWRPLVVLGLWSYVVYLVHWPVFVFVTSPRTGLAEHFVFPARIIVTLVIAALVRHLVEIPVRRRRSYRLPRARWIANGVVTASVIVVIVVARAGVPAATDFAAELPGERIFIGGTATAPSAAVAGDAPVELLMLGGKPKGESGEIADAPGFVVVDRRTTDCSIAPGAEVHRLDSVLDTRDCIPATADWPTTLAEVGPDAVLLTLSPADLGRFRLSPDSPLLSLQDSRLHLRRHVIQAIRALREFDGIVLIGSTDGFEPFDAEHLEWVLAAATRDDPSILTVTGVIRSTNSPLVRSTVMSALAARVGSESGGSPQRVLVLGDSTAIRFARLIFDKSAGAFESVSLAQEGCPLLPADRSRWWEGMELDLSTCPKTADIVRYVERFAPSVVLICASMTVQSEIRFGDGPWIDPTSDDFVRLNDEFMVSLQAILPEDVVVVSLTSPTVPNVGYGGSPMARPERIGAWNAQMSRWDAAWPNVHLIDWAGAIDRLEADWGSMRPDGVHLIDDATDWLVEAVVLPSLRRLAP
jgi:peptidoglycan/LPS O-acetylase OafA/YrhL